MDLPLTKLAETATTVTLGWTPIPCLGYVLYADGVRKSNSWDQSKSSWKTNKATEIRVVALGAAAEGVWPPVIPPPTAQFGADLPVRQKASPGPVVEVASLAALRTAISSGQAGRIVKLTASIDLGGQDLVINCQGTDVAPITVDLAAPVSNGRVLISRAAYANVRFIDLGYSPSYDGLKITDGSHHVDVDGRGGRIHHAKGQGILVTDPTTRDWQIWNVRIEDVGSETNKDHGIYTATAKGVCVIGNVIVTNPQAFGFQFYPDVDSLICTSCESHGGRTRGGYILGTEYQATKNVKIVGSIITRTQPTTVAVGTYPPGYVVQGGVVYDSIEWQTSGWGSGMTYEHCVGADPAVTAKGFVLPVRYGLHPTHDIDGRPFVTADAGAVAY